MTSTDQATLLKQLRCCSATKAVEVASMFNSGNENSKCEFNKLALLIKYINVLSCHRSPLEVNSYSVVNSAVVTTTTTTEYDNCLTEDQADILAEQASLICDICN